LLSGLLLRDLDRLLAPSLGETSEVPLSHFFSFSLYDAVASEQYSLMSVSRTLNSLLFLERDVFSASSDSSASESLSEADESDPYPERRV